jgi:Fe-S-cluster containining protein
MPNMDDRSQNSATSSPLGYAQEVEQLMKMPQSLCKQRGTCCRITTFKGSLNIDDIKALAADPSAPDHESAHDFASLFLPYTNQGEVREIANEFVERVRASASKKGQDPDAVTFFHCKFVLEDGRCGIHEDRPLGCRVYPFPHKSTLYHPDCGFESQGMKNWARVVEIMKTLGMPPEQYQ